MENNSKFLLKWHFYDILKGISFICNLFVDFTILCDILLSYAFNYKKDLKFLLKRHFEVNI